MPTFKSACLEKRFRTEGTENTEGTEKDENKKTCRTEVRRFPGVPRRSQAFPVRSRQTPPQVLRFFVL